MFVVYGLFSSRDNVIRYIGETTNFEQRFKSHLSEATKSTKSDKCNWISSEMKEGYQILYVILMENATPNHDERRFLDIYNLKDKAQITNTVSTPELKSKTIKGIEEAKKRGVKMGRPLALSTEQEIEIANRKADGASLSELAREHDVSRACIQRVVKRQITNILSTPAAKSARELGVEKARKSLAETGLTHKGKTSLGRPCAADSITVVAWRKESGASIAETSKHFGISLATVKRYCSTKGN